MIKDPVCGMEIDPAQARATRQVGDHQTFYFCSAFCAQFFDPQMTEPELARLRAAIEDASTQRRIMPLWWIRYWTGKGIQALKARYLGGKS